MTRSLWFRTSALLLLLIPLASPAVAADRTPARPQGYKVVAWIRHAITEVQKTLLPQGTAQGDSHGGMDPDGLTSAPPAGSDSQGTMDPDG